ncbi:MAG: amidohydrolase family protein, partial [Alistipes ihumii]|nr:amidohydrolase family protein [Alistipes ihumii]
SLNIPVLAHCEDINMVVGGVVNADKDMAAKGWKGITNAVEDVIVARDILLAKETGARLHLCHCSTKDSVRMVKAAKLDGVDVSAEVCPHHFTLTSADIPGNDANYKMNPPLRTKEDVEALKQGLHDNIMDVIATDHAPHTLEEKERPYASAPSGGPLVQHSLPMMLELSAQGVLPVETIVEKMCHAPARLFGVRDRGFLRTGYFADIVLVRPADPWTVSKENILYKCGWSPLEGTAFSHRIVRTLVNGRTVYADGRVDTTHRGAELEFDR